MLRQMLRWMLGIRRKRSQEESDQDATDSEPEEPEEDFTESSEDDKLNEETWVDWIKRSTGIVQSQLEKASISDWIIGQRVRKWRLAGHTARRSDGRWSTAVLTWQPSGGCRNRGHPSKRWADPLDAFFFERDGSPRNYWKSAARNRESWSTLEKEFVAKSWHR